MVVSADPQESLDDYPIDSNDPDPNGAFNDKINKEVNKSIDEHLKQLSAAGSNGSRNEPNQTLHQTLTLPQQQVVEWLKSNKLEAYAASFIENGYDDMNDFKNYNVEHVDELIKQIKPKAGHKVKIKKLFEEISDKIAKNNKPRSFNSFDEENENNDSNDIEEKKIFKIPKRGMSQECRNWMKDNLLGEYISSFEREGWLTFQDIAQLQPHQIANKIGMKYGHQYRLNLLFQRRIRDRSPFVFQHPFYLSHSFSPNLPPDSRI